MCREKPVCRECGKEEGKGPAHCPACVYVENDRIREAAARKMEGK